MCMGSDLVLQRTWKRLHFWNLVGGNDTLSQSLHHWRMQMEQSGENGQEASKGDTWDIHKLPLRGEGVENEGGGQE